MGERRPQTAKIAANQTGQPTGDLHRVRYRLRSAVSVLEADDVVLAEIGARLHLDEVERDLAGIFEAVARAERNVGRLVLVQDQLLIALGHLGGAGDDDPVLGAMVMHLQRQPAARLDHDMLDLHAVAVMDRAVGAPGAVHQRVGGELVAIAALEPRDEPLHILGAVAARDHHRIGGRDDDEILHPERCNQAGFGAQIGVPANPRR